MTQRICKHCHYGHRTEGLQDHLVVCDYDSAAHTRSFRIIAADHACSAFAFAYCHFPLPETPPGTRRIPLTRGLYAVVDESDYDWLSQYRWRTCKGTCTCYAVTKSGGKTVFMHRLITNAPPNLVVDHIDHNGLNNRRSNLRTCTPAQNSQNKRPQRNNSSKYKGVSWLPVKKRFRAKLTCADKNYYLGAFHDEEAAARAYDKKAKELFGEFAYLNFPND